MSYVVVSKTTRDVPIIRPVPSEEILRKALRMYSKKDVVVSSCSGNDDKKILHFTGTVLTHLLERDLWTHERPSQRGYRWDFEWHLDDK
ncbi:hypothetical protein [Herbaspirillum sp. CF444]|uniref:hypothetical protein n=1 Tax=Herbaspirillum sp. CF444 TaxID=1144319 RepID=UPI0012F7F8A4|nr:hypothetical protein [Herbaspirillum sp. CF444]